MKPQTLVSHTLERSCWGVGGGEGVEGGGGFHRDALTTSSSSDEDDCLVQN